MRRVLMVLSLAALAARATSAHVICHDGACGSVGVMRDPCTLLDRDGQVIDGVGMLTTNTWTAHGYSPGTMHLLCRATLAPGNTVTWTPENTGRPCYLR